MFQQWSNEVVNGLADGAGEISSAAIDVSTYKNAYFQFLSGSSGTISIDITSVPASVTGGQSSVPLDTSWQSVSSGSSPGGAWASTSAVNFATKWLRVRFYSGTPGDAVRIVMTAEG